MNIKNYIQQSYDLAVQRGEFDCPECLDEYNEPTGCGVCNRTAINPNKNIGEMLMRVVEELSLAGIAHREGRFANMEAYKNCLTDDDVLESDKPDYISVSFEFLVKYTHEDKLADACIRIFELCGYLGIEWLRTSVSVVWKSENVGQKIRQVCKYFNNIDEDNLTNFDMIHGCLFVEELAKSFNIPIEKHIDAKLAHMRDVQ
jgi:hypothetical protein